MSVYAAETGRLWLQLLSEDDHLYDYHKIMTAPECLAWSRKTVHTSLDETRLLICTTTPTDIEPWKKVYAILLRPDPLSQVAGSSLATTEVEKPRMIGVLGSPREAELAYKLHPDFWGKGYMSEALKAFIEIYWAENKTENHLRAFADPENLGSVRVLQKAGFKNITTMSNHYVRAVNNKSGKRSSLTMFWLGRLGTFEPKHDRSLFPNLGVNEESHDELKKSVNEMFAK